MNKMLFRFKRDFNDDIMLIANNHHDIIDHIRENYNWYEFGVTGDAESIYVIEQKGFEKEFASLEWVKHI